MTLLYVCPNSIIKAWEENPHKGRAEIIEWMKTLPIKTGDKIWTPETGWLVKEPITLH